MRFFGIFCLVAGFAIYSHYGYKYILNPTSDAARLQVRASNQDFSIGLMIIGSIFTAAGFAVASLKKAAARGARRLPDRYPCPMCAEAILPAAKICPQCKSALPAGWA